MNCSHLLIVCTFFTASCAQRQVKILPPSRVVVDPLGTRWIDVNSGDCIFKAVSLNSEHLRFTKHAPLNTDTSCEITQPLHMPSLAKAAKEIMSSYTLSNTSRLNIELYLESSPSLIIKWAKHLRASPHWQNRRKLRRAGGSSEYELIRILLQESSVFDAYKPIHDEFPNLRNKTIYIEKVSYVTANTFGFYGSDLKPMGYSANDQIPIPLIIVLKMESHSNPK